MPQSNLVINAWYGIQLITTGRLRSEIGYINQRVLTLLPPSKSQTIGLWWNATTRIRKHCVSVVIHWSVIEMLLPITKKALCASVELMLCDWNATAHSLVCLCLNYRIGLWLECHCPVLKQPCVLVLNYWSMAVMPLPSSITALCVCVRTVGLWLEFHWLLPRKHCVPKELFVSDWNATGHY